MSVVSIVTELARPVVESRGLILWDVEFKKEGGEWYLRVYVDREDGVDIADCVEISQQMDPILDEADPIEQSYNFEVCSAGLVRELKTDEHINRYLDKTVSVSLYALQEGIETKKFDCVLKHLSPEYITVEKNGESVELKRTNIAKIIIDLV